MDWKSFPQTLQHGYWDENKKISILQVEVGDTVYKLINSQLYFCGTTFSLRLVCTVSLSQNLLSFRPAIVGLFEICGDIMIKPLS